MPLTPISHYPLHLQEAVKERLEAGTLDGYIQKKYPASHAITNDKALFTYVNGLKQRHLKKFPPLSKVAYDAKIDVVKNALGVHRFVSRVQGGKLKAKNEVYIASVFKDAPEAFLEMIVVHELAHFKSKEHDKAFYQFCTHLLPSYHQVEFDFRVWLVVRAVEKKEGV